MTKIFDKCVQISISTLLWKQETVPCIDIDFDQTNEPIKSTNYFLNIYP